MTRVPDPPHTAPPGTVWVEVPEDPRMWRVEQGRACRYTVSHHATCGADSAAAANRGRTIGGRRVAAWWAYCPDHLADYGRWVRDGRVWCWTLAGPDRDFYNPMEAR